MMRDDMDVSQVRPRDQTYLDTETTSLHLFGRTPAGDQFHCGGCWCKWIAGHSNPYRDGNPKDTVYWWSALVITESPKTAPKVGMPA
jgi:hypothetical protein